MISFLIPYLYLLVFSIVSIFSYCLVLTVIFGIIELVIRLLRGGWVFVVKLLAISYSVLALVSTLVWVLPVLVMKFAAKKWQLELDDLDGIGSALVAVFTVPIFIVDLFVKLNSHLFDASVKPAGAELPIPQD